MPPREPYTDFLPNLLRGWEPFLTGSVYTDGTAATSGSVALVKLSVMKHLIVVLVCLSMTVFTLSHFITAIMYICILEEMLILTGI